MGLFNIKQPSGVSGSVKGGGSFVFLWSGNFAAKWTGKYQSAQRWLDSEVLRLCDPLTPKQTGNLIESGTLGTELGSGTVRWIAVYSAYQYYTETLDHSTSINPNGGPKWFERMKASNLQYLTNGVQKYMRGQGE